MKTSEIIQRRYKAGERDFKNVNLRGQFFRKANLAGADFSNADIRGASFAKANLTGAKFTKAKAGLQKRWAISLLVVALPLITLSAFFTAFASGIMGSLFRDPSLGNQLIFGYVVVVTLGLYYWFFFREGISYGSSVVLYVLLVIVLSVALIILLAAARFMLLSDVFSVLLAVAFYAALSVVLYITFSVLLAIAFSVALYMSISVALYAALSIVLYVEIVVPLNRDPTAIAFTSVLNLVSLGLNLYLAYRAYRGDERDAWVRGITIAVAATGGTNFSGAILTEADFSQATLKNTNFRNAKLTRTNFHDANKLDFARVGNTILTATPVRKLLVDGNGAKQDYTRANLRGANLDGANLEGAILKYADLSEASLIGANLQAANLTETQAVGTNFTQARLTGACLEAWNIDNTTILSNIECLWVYLAEKERENSNQWGERRPNSGNFKPGEFTQVFTEILDTVDLIFREEIDWWAFVTALKKAEAEENASMQSIKDIGDGAIEVKLNVPPDVDKEKIHNTFTQDYNQLLQEVKADKASEKFHELLHLLASNQQNLNINNKTINNSEDNSQNITIGDNLRAGNFAANLRDISENVSNTIQKLPETTSSDTPGIKELLTQLQTAIETETELSDKGKTKALKQVQKLATAGEDPQANQDDADDSLTMLKGIVSGIKETAKLVTTCNEIIPLLTGLFGL